jgi:iron-sulfur cluster repair protein YtfE (RIC family)
MNGDGLQRVRREHLDLRGLLGALDDAASRVVEQAPGAISELRAAVRVLDVSFRAHILMEETTLVPVLPEGAIDRLHREHAEQRAALLALASEVEADHGEPVRLADDARWLVRGLLRDMQEEDGALDGLVPREGER